jgi:2-keto-4-pentenoate hydratase/2-oxohepta-3-ene-1,7-dioic acid hydratase in catechol pathway
MHGEPSESVARTMGEPSAQRSDGVPRDGAVSPSARWMRFVDDTGRVSFGTLEDDIVAVHSGDMFARSEPSGERLPLGALRVLPPCEPTKVIGLWNNLAEAAERQGWSRPVEPLYFLKPHSAVVSHLAAVVRPACYGGRILYEGELGIVIGRACSNVVIGEVDDVVFGYTCVNDVTAFDLVAEDESFAQWTRAKSFDTFCPLGPVIAAGVSPDSLRVRTLVGGKVRQDYPVSDMFFSPRQLVSLVSRDMTLLPGDVISCGTSTGAMPMRPDVEVEVEIDGIGVLRNALSGQSRNG